jgi:parvulin-like peptidyl-prolyl isomerase
MDIKLLLWDWRFILAVGLGFVVYAVVDWKNFKILINQAITVAKSKAKDGVLESGQDQENWVVEKVYEVMPARIKLFVNKELLRKIVNKAYHIAKDLLDDGKLNGSILDRL